MAALVINNKKQKGYFLSLIFLLLMMMSTYMLLMINIITDLKKVLDQYQTRIYLQKNIMIWVKDFSKKISAGSERIVLPDKTIVTYHCNTIIAEKNLYTCEALITKDIVSEQVEFVVSKSELSIRYLYN